MNDESINWFFFSLGNISKTRMLVSIISDTNPPQIETFTIRNIKEIGSKYFPTQTVVSIVRMHGQKFKDSLGTYCHQWYSWYFCSWRRKISFPCYQTDKNDREKWHVSLLCWLLITLNRLCASYIVSLWLLPICSIPTESRGHFLFKK